MSSFTLTDALTGDRITFDYATGNAAIGARADEGPAQAHDAIFYPGCSAINYAMPLVVQAYEALQEAEVVTGMSVLCCGKILRYEPDGENTRAAFEEQLRKRLIETGVKRMVCACPNCVEALRNSLAKDPRTMQIELLVLPQVLADLGHRINPEVTARLIKGNQGSPTLLCTHDSCPDRETGQFANGLRALMTHELWTDPEHCRARSICCGSLPRAAGKFEAADACAAKNGEEAKAVQADALVTACMSCTFQLNLAQLAMV